MAEKYDVVVIGSGPGGYYAAIRAARRGASVAVVEKGLVGGTCLNRGCIPSKSLLASAHTLLDARDAAMMGIDVALAAPNWKKIKSRKNAIVSGFRKGLTGLISANGIRIIAGRGVAEGGGMVRVETESGAEQIAAENLILATGSEPAGLAEIPFDGTVVISSDEALDLAAIPRSMLVIGGGVIGCEMACLYAALGAKVTIVEALPQLLDTEDEWVGRLLKREFNKLGIETIVSQKATRLEKTESSAKVTLHDGRNIAAEKVLVAVGRRPVIDSETVESLGLKMNGVSVSVDEGMHTNTDGVYAIGDLVGTTYLAHGAFAEAEVAAANATGGNNRIGDYRLIPRAVYSFPEVATVGRTEKACNRDGIDFSSGRSSFAANGRSAAEGRTTGEARVLQDKSTGAVIGVTIAGDTATEHIAAARALLGGREKITDISFPHPTMSEVLKEAWEDAFGQSVHGPPR